MLALHSPLPAASLALGLAVSAASATVLAGDVVRSAVADTAAVNGQASAVWYADNSCRLRVDGLEEIGVTSIDADMNESVARTMINCDAESGHRLTLMLQGSGLALGERKVLAAPDELGTDVDASVAWVTRVRRSEDQVAPDEVAARRYFADGTVMIRETPGVDASDSTLHADRQAFAEINGSLVVPYKTDNAPTGSAAADQPATDTEEAPRIVRRWLAIGGDGTEALKLTY